MDNRACSLRSSAGQSIYLKNKFLMKYSLHFCTMRKKCFAVLLILLMPAEVALAEFRSSVGFGIQFGGVLGWQGSYHLGASKFRASLGIVGLSVGYDYFVADRISVGVQGFIWGLSGGTAINANYYFADQGVSGWMAGLDVFSAVSGYIGSDDSSHQGVLVSFGYTF